MPSQTMPSQSRAIVLGGNGHLGQTLIHQLLARNIEVISVNRSSAQPIKGVHYIQGDLRDPDFVRSIASLASLVFHCASPAYHRWKDDFLPMTQAIISGFSNGNSKLVYADNLYAYGQRDYPLQETDDELATGMKGIIRSQAARSLLAAHAEQKLQVTIARASDFYGPNVKQALLGEHVFGACLNKKSATYVGKMSTKHSFTFIDDFARAMQLLAFDQQSVGEVWHVPNAPAIRVSDLLKKIYQQAGCDYQVTNINGLFETALSWVMPSVRAIQETRYQRDNDFIVNDSKFLDHFDFTPTSLEDGISKTLAFWNTTPPVRPAS